MGDNLPPIQEKQRKARGGDDDNEKWQAKNWGFFKKGDVRKMNPQLRSRFLAYEEPDKDAQEAKSQSIKRISERQKQCLRGGGQMQEEDEKDKHEKLIGQLKAAEARNRIRIMRLRYESNRTHEINHLIACQSTARKAVRLQALLPVKHQDRSQGDRLDKLQRQRVELLMDDDRGLLTGRT